MGIVKIWNSLENRIKTHYYQKQDFSLNRHIVVIESDEGGAVRMPSKDVYNNLKGKLNFSACHYCANDSILEKDDLELLCEVLGTVKDINGNYAKITTNFVTSNPDFERIKKDGFQNYYNESILLTYEKYENIAFSNIQKAINDNYIYPQLHGREHLNVKRWMALLQSGNSDFRLAFESGMYGLSTTVTNTEHDSVMAAFDSHLINQNILSDAVGQFEAIFGFKSKSFIAPNYCWNRDVEDVLSLNGVEYIQGARAQVCKSSKENNIFHYIGQVNHRNQIYLVRNVVFEPSSDLHKDWLNECKRQIEICLKNGNPIIISSHRVNFVGRINKKNRDNSLRQLLELLKWVSLKWPDVEFMSSDELGEVIRNNKIK